MKKYILAVFSLIMIMAYSFNVNANESTEQLLMKTNVKTDVYEEQNENSQIVVVLDKDTPILCTGSIEEKWVFVTYQEYSGYVLTKNIETYADESLDKEFVNVHENNKLIFEEIIVAQKQHNSDLLWGSIIIALLVLIFLIGIFSALKKK